MVANHSALDPMVIAHVVSTYPPYRGGMGNVAHELATRTAMRGQVVHVVTPWNHGDTEERARGDGVSVHRVRPWMQCGNAAWCPSIRRALEQLQPDIVHLHWPFIGGVNPVIAWRLHDGNQRRRLVVQYHMDLLAHGWRGVIFQWYQRRTLPWLLHFADRVVVSSFDYAQHSVLAPHLAMLGGRVREISLGVDAVRFSPSRRSGETARLARVLFVGGLDRAHAFKGIDVLLRALTEIHGCQLRIVGDGDVRSTYETNVRRLRIGDRITFLGALPDDALIREYRTADVLVLPSVARSEAFGLVLLEAMGCGTPVIASDLPGVRTVVTPETGFLVPPNDVRALATTLQQFTDRSEEERQAMRSAARARAAHYGWERIVVQWISVYSAA